jgi:hypothetical protein
VRAEGLERERVELGRGARDAHRDRPVVGDDLDRPDVPLGERRAAIESAKESNWMSLCMMWALALHFYLRAGAA